MSKQIVYGHPWLYWRRFLLPGIISFLMMTMPGFVILLIQQLEINVPEPVIITMVFLQATGWVWLWVSLARGHRLVKSYRKSKGFRCLVCWYEMLPGQTTCPECGMPWVRKVLKAPWKIAD